MELNAFTIRQHVLEVDNISEDSLSYNHGSLKALFPDNKSVPHPPDGQRSKCYFKDRLGGHGSLV